MASSLNTNALREVKSCGFLIMKPDQSFLLMKHPNRYDLPKGHMDIGETEHQTAIRGTKKQSLLSNKIRIQINNL